MTVMMGMGVVVAENSAIVPRIYKVVYVCHAVFNHLTKMILPHINLNYTAPFFGAYKKLF